MNLNNSNSKNNNCCLICFNTVNDGNSLSSIFSTFKPICNKCLSSFKDMNLIEKHFGINVMFLYEYNSFFKKVLYQYKGCYDIELKDVFFYKYLNLIRRKYRGYTIVFPPSSDIDNDKRGYKHIEKMCDILKLNIIDVFYKRVNYKQSSHYYKDRKDISLIIDFKKNIRFRNDKYLIIDDVFTSGSTLKTIINLLTSKGVKKENISAIILSKTKKEPN